MDFVVHTKPVAMARNKIYEISANISAKFRLLVEIDKISPPIFDYTKFP